MWVQLGAGSATLGLSRHAAAELGELTFVELPCSGAPVVRGGVLCVVESVKTAADLCSPVGGTVCDTNRLLEDQPSLINSSPEGEGWVCRLTDVDPVEAASLMTAAQYAAYVAHQGDR